MGVKGFVYKRCGCQVSGRRLGVRCPSLRRRGHGSWYLALDVPAGIDGRRRRIRRGGFASRAAAEEKLAELRLPQAETPATGVLTTGQWLHVWLGSRVSLRPNTLRSYGEHVSGYLVPGLGGIPLRELSVGDVQRMFAALIRRGTVGAGR